MTQTAKPNLLIELLITLIVPSLILMKLSGPGDLGTVNALLLALAFPLVWGARSLLRERKVNYLAVLGLINILLTGGIGLLQLDTQWLAIKEAAVPGLIGLVVIGSGFTRKPLVRVLLFNPTLMNTERIQTSLDTQGTAPIFETRLRNATWMMGGSFFFSSVMNYFLATWIVTSPAGTAAFNEELGQLALLSYPVIALPSTLLLMATLYYLARSIRELAGLSLTDAINH